MAIDDVIRKWFKLKPKKPSQLFTVEQLKRLGCEHFKQNEDFYIQSDENKKPVALYGIYDRKKELYEMLIKY